MRLIDSASITSTHFPFQTKYDKRIGISCKKGKSSQKVFNTKTKGWSPMHRTPLRLPKIIPSTCYNKDAQITERSCVC